MGSVSGTGTASRDRFSQDTWENTNQTRNEQTDANREGSRRAVFDSPQGQSILGFLTDQTQQGGQFQGQAGNAYGSLASLRQGPNPEVENIIKSTNREADTNFANRLAQSRAGGYRGGTGAGLYDQDRIAAEFTNQQAGDNAALRYGAYNDAAGRNLTANVAGAGGLAGLSGQNASLGAQILALLRGEDTADQTQQLTNANTLQTLRGGTSGTKSNTGQSITGSYSYT
jgi:hypothetical protein